MEDRQLIPRFLFVCLPHGFTQPRGSPLLCTQENPTDMHAQLTAPHLNLKDQSDTTAPCYILNMDRNK